MAITPYSAFDPQVKWYQGAGCLHCGSNVSAEGRKVGVQCVDFGVEDDWRGRFGLCYDCALQVALAIDCVPSAKAGEIVDAVQGRYDEAEALAAQAAADAAQARLDRDTVERLIGSVYQPPEQPGEPFGAGVGA